MMMMSAVARPTESRLPGYICEVMKDLSGTQNRTVTVTISNAINDSRDPDVVQFASAGMSSSSLPTLLVLCTACCIQWDDQILHPTTHIPLIHHGSSRSNHSPNSFLIPGPACSLKLSRRHPSRAVSSPSASKIKKSWPAWHRNAGQSWQSLRHVYIRRLNHRSPHELDHS